MYPHFLNICELLLINIVLGITMYHLKYKSVTNICRVLSPSRYLDRILFETRSFAFEFSQLCYSFVVGHRDSVNGTFLAGDTC